MTADSPDLSILEEFPPELRALVLEELSAGNAIVAIHREFPAPADGACVQLERLVTTHARANANGVEFVRRDVDTNAGEFRDVAWKYFVLEPIPVPDMNAIREALAERERKANASRDLFY